MLRLAPTIMTKAYTLHLVHIKNSVACRYISVIIELNIFIAIKVLDMKKFI